GSALGVRERLAIEGRGDLLLRRGAGEQVACELLDRELIERQVFIEGANRPVAEHVSVGPGAIFFIAVTVGIASQVEPVPPPALAEVRRREEAIDERLVGL